MKPAPQLVPWAGEFVGKYLISAIQALRMSESEELRATVTNVVTRLIESQAEDGYLGPFKNGERLLGHWDLWGHYHCMLALLMWHEQTGDQAALSCARRAADLVCRTYLDSGRRALEAEESRRNSNSPAARAFSTRHVRNRTRMRKRRCDMPRGYIHPPGQTTLSRTPFSLDLSVRQSCA